MKTLAIDLVGGAAKIAADGFLGVLTLLRLYGGSWGWPYKARHKRPRSTPIATLVFSPVLLFFFNRQSRIVSHMFALRFSAVLLGLEPPMFYLRKKNTKFDAKSDDRCSVSKGKWQKEAVLWAACTSRGGQYD